MGLSCYKWYQSQLLGGVPARTLGSQEGRLWDLTSVGDENFLIRVWLWDHTSVVKGNETFLIRVWLWDPTSVGKGNETFLIRAWLWDNPTSVGEGNKTFLIRVWLRDPTLIGWRGEQNISYKGVIARSHIIRVWKPLTNRHVSKDLVLTFEEQPS